MKAKFRNVKTNMLKQELPPLHRLAANNDIEKLAKELVKAIRKCADTDIEDIDYKHSTLFYKNEDISVITVPAPVTTNDGPINFTIIETKLMEWLEIKTQVRRRWGRKDLFDYISELLNCGCDYTIGIRGDLLGTLLSCVLFLTTED